MKYSKITISGKVCTGKSTLFRTLADDLKWKTFSTSTYFREYVKKNGMNLETAEEQNEIITKKIDYKVKNMLQEKGNLIVEGWMAGIMADNLPDVLRILLISDDTVRIQRFCIREDADAHTALELITDRERHLFSKLSEIYKRDDFVDPKNYNLVIDTTDLDTREVFEKVKRELEQ